MLRLLKLMPCMSWTALLATAFVSVQASGDMLDDGKYQCNIKDELAQKLAHNLQISLDSYLLYL